MNHRFTLPIAVAVTLHATLLFGFRRAPGSSPLRPIKTTTVSKPFYLPIEKLEERSESGETAIRKGFNDVSRSEIEDKIVSTKREDFTVDVAPLNPSLTPGDIKIDSRLFGDPIGDPDSPKIEGGPLFTPGMLDNPPNARVRISPDYPHAAKAANLEGEVLVEFVVNETGRVVNPVIVHSTDPIFEAPTLRAVAKWHFAPGKHDGRVVRFRMAAPVVFRLDEN